MFFWPIIRRLHEEHFLHIVVTRFNLGRPSVEWLAPRLVLFERFALPSVLGQSRKNFRWLLLCDEDTEPPARDRLERYISGQIEIVWTSRDRHEFFQRILQLRETRHTHLVTTRIDTDDAIARHFIARVQEASKRTRGRYFINLPAGYRWFHGKVAPARHRSNQFISCCEPFHDCRTVHCGAKHTQLRNVAPVVQVARHTPSWLYTCHGANTWLRPPDVCRAAWREEAELKNTFAVDWNASLKEVDPRKAAQG